MNKNRLWGMRSYLVGAMDRAPDGGREWRDYISEKLKEIGVIPLNPCDKPIDIGFERLEDRQYRQQLKANNNYEELAKQVKLLRIVDLRMVDMADFIICYLDVDVHACGTYEELFWANRLKNPVLIVCKQGKSHAPDWLFGTIPHQHIFDDFDTLLKYLHHVAFDEKVEHMKRWMFFNYKDILS